MATPASIGTPVAIIHPYGGSGFGRNRISFGAKVKAVTPSGRVTTIDGFGKERQFDAKGNEVAYKGNYVSPSMYDRDTLRFDVEALQAVEHEYARKEAAAHAVNAVKLVEPVRPTWSKADLQTRVEGLKALLAKAEAAVEAI